MTSLGGDDNLETGFDQQPQAILKKDLPVTHINIKEKSVDVNKGKINTTNTNWKAVNYKRKAEWISRVCRDAENDEKKIKFAMGVKLLNITTARGKKKGGNNTRIFLMPQANWQ